MIIGGLVVAGVRPKQQPLEVVALAAVGCRPASKGGLLPGHAALGEMDIGRRVGAKDPHRLGKVPRPGPGNAGQEQNDWENGDGGAMKRGMASNRPAW